MRKAINFIRLRWYFITFSLLLIVAGVVGYVVNGGFNLSIDFTAGLDQQFQINPAARAVKIAEVRQALAPLGRYDLQAVGAAAQQQFVVKVMADPAVADFQARTEARILELLEQTFGAGNITVQSSDFVGPRYSQQLATQTIWILLVAVTLILLYAAFRFKFVYGMAAVLCLMHDALFMLSVTALFRVEFTTTTVAAILTIIGYSINDTIVIFDRVRENRGLMRDVELGMLLNTSITQTLTRTILTSLTTMMAVLALVILAQGDIQHFAMLMVVGIVEGTYSTIFVASPIVYMWTRSSEKRRKARELARYGQGLPPAPRRAAAQVEPEAQSFEAEAMAAEVSEEELPAGVERSPQEAAPAAGAALPRTQSGAAGPPRADAAQVGSPAAQPGQAVPQETGSAAGGYIRVQRRHKKRKR
jgi:preprotein translocase subunit SecF